MEYRNLKNRKILKLILKLITSHILNTSFIRTFVKGNSIRYTTQYYCVNIVLHLWKASKIIKSNFTTEQLIT